MRAEHLLVEMPAPSLVGTAYTQYIYLSASHLAPHDCRERACLLSVSQSTLRDGSCVYLILPLWVIAFIF